MRLFVVNGDREEDSSRNVSRPAIVATEDHPDGWFVLNLEEIEYLEGDGTTEGIKIHYKSGRVLVLKCGSKRDRDLLLMSIIRAAR